MDILSELIELARLRPALDLHCLLGGRYHVDHGPAAPGMLPFHLVLGGACILELQGGRRVHLFSGDMLLLTKGSAHAVVNIGKRDVSGDLVIRQGYIPQRRTEGVAPDVDLLCGHFEYDPRSSGLLLDGLPEVFQVSLSGQHSTSRLSALVGILKDETTREQPGALTIMSAMSLALLTMALRSAGADATTGLPGLMKDTRLSKAVRAMLENAARQWTLEELADISAISRATFARHFKTASGMTVGEFLTEFRMAKAADLLLRGVAPVAEIAETVGYESEAAFGRAFRRNRGMTPGRFRSGSVHG